MMRVFRWMILIATAPLGLAFGAVFLVMGAVETCVFFVTEAWEDAFDSAIAWLRRKTS